MDPPACARARLEMPTNRGAAYAHAWTLQRARVHAKKCQQIEEQLKRMHGLSSVRACTLRNASKLRSSLSACMEVLTDYQVLTDYYWPTLQVLN